IASGHHRLEVEAGGIHQVKPWFAGKLDFAPVIAFGGDADFPLQGGAVEYFLDPRRQCSSTGAASTPSRSSCSGPTGSRGRPAAARPLGPSAGSASSCGEQGSWATLSSRTSMQGSCRTWPGDSTGPDHAGTRCTKRSNGPQAAYGASSDFREPRAAVL